MNKIINLTLKGAVLGLLLCPAIPVLAADAPAQAQSPASPSHSYTVKGIVTDTSGEGLPGATIFVKNTKTGTSTGIDGDFEIALVSPGEVTLVVSYVGMQTKEVKTTTGSTCNVVLEESSDMLSEVIVSGFQTISRERNTGAAVVINADKLDKIQSADLSSKLEGIAPGQINSPVALDFFAAIFAALAEFSMVAERLCPERTEAAYCFLMARFCCHREMGLLASWGLSRICF